MKLNDLFENKKDVKDRNPVAKELRSNPLYKAKTEIDRKKEVKKGYQKHKSKIEEDKGPSDMGMNKYGLSATKMGDEWKSYRHGKLTGTFNSQEELAKHQQELIKNEATIKPYVSMYTGDDGKMIYDVLDANGKSAYQSDDKQDAFDFLKDNYKRLLIPRPTSEAEVSDLGSMNDKMKGVLSKVRDQDTDDQKADAERKEKEREAKVKELGDAGMQDYVQKLKSHDWTYEYSDDHSVWQRGSAEKKELRRLADILDPKHEIWNKYDPFAKKVETSGYEGQVEPHKHVFKTIDYETIKQIIDDKKLKAFPEKLPNGHVAVHTMNPSRKELVKVMGVAETLEEGIFGENLASVKQSDPLKVIGNLAMRKDNNPFPVKTRDGSIEVTPSQAQKFINKFYRASEFTRDQYLDRLKTMQTAKKVFEDEAEGVSGEEFSDKQIKMAFGVLNDPRYHQGNYSGAVATIEKIAKGLSKHPSVANALKRANESKMENKMNEQFNTEKDQVQAILDKHNVKSIDDIEYGSDVYEELFGYYMDSGEMPYGVMKARDGMPDEWIADRLYDLGLLEDTHDNLLNRSNRNKDNEILRLSQLSGIVPRDLTMEDYSKMTHDLISKLIGDGMSDEEIQARTGETGKRIKIIRKHVEDDAMDRAQQAYKLARDEQPAEATQDLARSLNPFKSAVDTNVSPQLTAKGLDAITKGDRPTPNQIKAVEPYVSKLAKAISNPQTSAQMRNVFKKVQ